MAGTAEESHLARRPGQLGRNRVEADLNPSGVEAAPQPVDQCVVATDQAELLVAGAVALFIVGIAGHPASADAIAVGSVISLDEVPQEVAIDWRHGAPSEELFERHVFV